jgi:Fic/DOC family
VTERTPSQKLADALDALKRLQDAGHRAVQSRALSRTHRERLTKAGFLREVVKGWYLPARPDVATWDTTAWRIGMPDFIAGYCNARFGDAWHVGPEQSLLLRTGERTMPLQILVWAPKGQNLRLELPHGYSMYLYSQMPKLLPAEASPENAGMRLVTIPAALVAVNQTFFTRHREAAQLALNSIDNSVELLRILLDGSHTVVSGRIAGALRAVGRADLADEILSTMRSTGSRVDEASPFDTAPTPLPGARNESPYVARLRLLWQDMRPAIVDVFPEPRKRATDSARAIADMEARYVADAYNSLSIEGYHVSAELIERVRSGAWDPDGEDKPARDAMAARGYYEAHARVKKYISQSIDRNEPIPTPARMREALASWYLALFSPSVQAGILKRSDLAGWRDGQVYIKNARHVPPPKEAVRECMPTLFELVANEPHAGVRAVLGHFIFVYVHPYMDGNGRLARFLMNAMLVTAGYAWTIVPLAERARYMRALDSASSDRDIRPFARFVAELVREQAKHPLEAPVGSARARGP